MRLSRAWRRLLLSWAGAVSLCITSAGILELLGGPASRDDRTALDQRMIADSIQSASVVPATIRVEPAASPPAIMETPRQAQPAPMVGAESVASRDNVDGSDVQPVAPVSAANVAPPSREETKRNPGRSASLQGKRVNLRITRDTERCPVVVCYRYHLVTERMKLPRHALVDLAGLRLAPHLRTGVDKGNIDLLIEAVEQRRTVRGRETPIFVATNLAGVTPHDTPF
jgi:hypothetical protein